MLCIDPPTARTFGWEMFLRILSVAPPLVSLFFFSAFVVAGVNVTASCTEPSFNWTFNSLGQSPCLVAATMLGTCFSGSYTLVPLPSGDAYGGPQPGYSDKCECSTVGYSLISACVACQGENTFYWSAYTANCTSTLTPGQFPNPVPSGIYVPHWAILDVTNENNWNANESYAAGDGPEYGPGAIFGASGVFTSGVSVSPTATSIPSPTAASSTASSMSSHSGGSMAAIMIAGGIIGGIAVISLICIAAIFYLRRRRRSRVASAGVGASQPILDDRGVVQPSDAAPLMRFYDPDDPTTYPEYRGPSVSSHIGSRSTLSLSLPGAQTRQASPHPKGQYKGLPMPSA